MRLRSVLRVREDGSRTGSAIFVAKKRRKQPHVNRTPRTQPDNSCVQRSRTSQTPLKLPPRTTRTYKIPNASPKECTRTSNTKTSPTKQNETNSEKQQTSNYTKHPPPPPTHPKPPRAPSDSAIRSDFIIIIFTAYLNKIVPFLRTLSRLWVPARRPWVPG